MSPFHVPPVITRPATASGTCLDHALTKFPDVFGVRFSWAISDHYFLSFYYCNKPHPPVDRFVSFKDVNRIDYEFLRFRLSLLDWGAIYAKHVIDEQILYCTVLYCIVFQKYLVWYKIVQDH
jgi:hypothetical protein